MPSCVYLFPSRGPSGLVDRPAFLHLVRTPPSRSRSRARAPPPSHQKQTGDRVGRFSGVGDCFVKTAREEGLGAFYKGFLPNFARLGSWNVIMFLTLEQVKKLFQPAGAAAA